MLTSSPWLALPNFTAAAEAGARIGLSQKQAADELAQKAKEAASQLGLGYSRLGVEAANAAAAHDLAEQSLALRGLFETGRLGQSDKRIADREDQNAAVNALHGRGLDLRDQRISDLEDNAAAGNALREQGLALRTTGNGGRSTRVTRDAFLDDGSAPPEKPYAVKMPDPSDPEGKRMISTRSNDPLYQEYKNKLFEKPVDPSTLYQPDVPQDGGITLPLPGQPGSPVGGDAAAAFLRPTAGLLTGNMSGFSGAQPRHPGVYMGDKGGDVRDISRDPLQIPPDSAPIISDPDAMLPQEISPKFVKGQIYRQNGKNFLYDGDGFIDQ